MNSEDGGLEFVVRESLTRIDISTAASAPARIPRDSRCETPCGMLGCCSWTSDSPCIRKDSMMPQGKEVFLGLNQTGVVAFIILIIVCLPLAWIPFLIDSCKGIPEQ